MRHGGDLRQQDDAWRVLRTYQLLRLKGVGTQREEVRRQQASLVVRQLSVLGAQPGVERGMVVGPLRRRVDDRERHPGPFLEEASQRPIADAQRFGDAADREGAIGEQREHRLEAQPLLETLQPFADVEEDLGREAGVVADADRFAELLASQLLLPEVVGQVVEDLLERAGSSLDFDARDALFTR